MVVVQCWLFEAVGKEVYIGPNAMVLSSKHAYSVHV